MKVDKKFSFRMITSGAGDTGTLMFLATKEQSAPGHPALKEKGSNIDAPGKSKNLATSRCTSKMLKLGYPKDGRCPLQVSIINN